MGKARHTTNEEGAAGCVRAGIMKRYRRRLPQFACERESGSEDPRRLKSALR